MKNDGTGEPPNAVGNLQDDHILRNEREYLFHCAYYTLITLGFPVFVVTLFLLSTRTGQSVLEGYHFSPSQFLMPGAFSAGFIALFFRQQWSFWLVALVSLMWVVEIVRFLAFAHPDPNEPGLVGIFTTFYAVTALYLFVLGVLGTFCGLLDRKIRSLDVQNGKKSV